MRTSWRDVTIDAIDFEIVRLSGGGSLPELGEFRDVFASEAPSWRLVAGYLMLESPPQVAGAVPYDDLQVCSHGRAVARLQLTGSTVRLTLETRSSAATHWREDRGVLRGPGIALVPEGKTSWSIDEGLLSIDRAAPWALTLVHGPAESKVDTRLQLLASLHAVGGRRA